MKNSTAIRVIICFLGLIGCVAWMVFSIIHKDFVAAIFWFLLADKLAEGTQDN